MNYRLLWKIALKNVWICFAAFFTLAVLFYQPIKITYNAVTGFSNVALNEINIGFLSGSLLWFSVMTLFTFELISQIKSVASQELWISAKKSAYKNIFLFSLINDAVCFGIILLYQGILFLLFGHGHVNYFFKIVLDMFFNYFVIGIIAALSAMIASFIKKQLAALIFLIAVIISISPIPDTVIGWFDKNTVINSIQKKFEILPQGLGYTYDFSTGTHVNVYSAGLQLLWAMLLLLILLILLKHKKRRAYIAAFIGIAAGAWILVQPHAERYASDSSESGMNIYEALQVYGIGDASEDFKETEVQEYNTNEKKLLDAGFSVTKYVMDIRVRWELSSTVTMWVDNAALSSYCFTLYHQYKVSSVTDQNGDPLGFSQDGDILTVSGTGDISRIVVTYQGTGAPCLADFDSIRLYAGFPWYPYPGEQFIALNIYDEILGSAVIEYTSCRNGVSEYELNVSSFFDIYTNLQKDLNGYTGQTDTLMLVGGMVTEEIEEGIHYIYPVELSYYYRYDKGIEDWKQSAREKKDTLYESGKSSEEFYIFYGSPVTFTSMYSEDYVCGQNIFVYNGTKQ